MNEDIDRLESLCRSEVVIARFGEQPDLIALIADVRKLRAAIRKHRDQRGDDRCWRDDEELYAVLPEGYTPPLRDAAVELANCERYIQCRQNPLTEYVSPQREIERLTAALTAKGAV